MTPYFLEAVDMRVRNSSQTLEVELVGDAARVLDVGCSSGYLGAALARAGRTVTGVERDPTAAEVARGRLDEVLVADINATRLSELFADRQFDVVVFGDVLEHLVDPAQALLDAAGLLAPGGAVVASIPNVAHGSLRLALLEGRWQYRDEGLLDRTHLHFFTRSEVMSLVHAAGLAVTRLYATVIDPLGAEVEIDLALIPRSLVEWVREQPDAFVYQFVLRAVPTAEVTGREPEEPEPAVELPVPPGDDLEYGATDAAQQLEKRLAALRTRDAIVGLEAALARSDSELARARHDKEVAQQMIDNMRRSRTWRAGRAVVAPLRAVLGGRRTVG